MADVEDDWGVSFSSFTFPEDDRFYFIKKPMDKKEIAREVMNMFAETFSKYDDESDAAYIRRAMSKRIKNLKVVALMTQVDYELAKAEFDRMNPKTGSPKYNELMGEITKTKEMMAVTMMNIDVTTRVMEEGLHKMGAV